MPRFTRHACVRYLLRGPGAGIGREARRRISLPAIEARARLSFAQSQFVSREQAAARVGPIAPRGWNYYYRLEPKGGGVWITSWRKGEEVVITYLHPKPARIRRFIPKEGCTALLGLPRKRLAEGAGSGVYVGTSRFKSEQAMLIKPTQRKRCDWHAVRPRPAPVKMGRHGGSGPGSDSRSGPGVLQ